MKTETIGLLALGAGLMASCDRSGLELLPQPNDAFPAVIEIGEMQVAPAADVLDWSSANCNATDDEGRTNCYYGQLSASDPVTVGGATFSFTGTGDSVCVVVDPETVFWNSFLDPNNVWGALDIYDDDGDLDLFGGLSSYYTGSPGIEIGDFQGFYTDSLGREISIDYVECYNESPYFEGEEGHAGRGTPEYCTINTAGREGIEYTVVLETFSVPLDDGILSFATGVFEGTCGSFGVNECTLTGEAIDIDGSTRTCSQDLEQAYCLNETESASARVLSRFCCLNPEACNEEQDEALCEELDLDGFCGEYPSLCGCAE